MTLSHAGQRTVKDILLRELLDQWRQDFGTDGLLKIIYCVGVTRPRYILDISYTLFDAVAVEQCPLRREDERPIPAAASARWICGAVALGRVGKR